MKVAIRLFLYMFLARVAVPRDENPVAIPADAVIQTRVFAGTRRGDPPVAPTGFLLPKPS